jgi:hypothetical protein
VVLIRFSFVERRFRLSVTTSGGQVRPILDTPFPTPVIDQPLPVSYAETLERTERS